MRGNVLALLRRAGVGRAIGCIQADSHVFEEGANLMCTLSPDLMTGASNVVQGKASPPLQRTSRTSYASPSPALCSSSSTRICPVFCPLSYSSWASPVTTQRTSRLSHQRKTTDVANATSAEMSAVHMPLHKSMPITLGGAM